MAVVFLTAGFVGAAEDNPEALVKELLANEKETVQVLKSVKDKASAEAAKPKLVELQKRMTESVEKLEKLEAWAKAHPDQAKELQKKFEGERKTLRQDVITESERISRLPEAKAVLKDVIKIRDLAAAKVDVARVQAKLLSDACDAYKVREGIYPESLEVLVQGGKVAQEALIDPWGRPYQYNPTGPKNKGLRADVWSQGPDPKDPKGIIGNWQEEKKPEKK